MVPDTVLNNILCSSCKKYLSVAPIKLYPGGIIKCGRCSRIGDNGKISLYNKMLENNYFPCINRYEGCRRALCLSDSQQHEKFCETSKNRCLICRNSSIFSAYELLTHFKSQHKNSIIDKPEFIVLPNYCYLYHSKNVILQIFVTQIDDIHMNIVGLDRYARKFSIIDSGPLPITVRCDSNFYKTWTNGMDITFHVQQDDSVLDAFTRPTNIYCKPRNFWYYSRQPFHLSLDFKAHYPTFKLHSHESIIYNCRNNKKINLLCFYCQQYYSHAVYFDDILKTFVCDDCACILNIIRSDNSCKCDKKVSNMFSMLGIKCKYGCKQIFNVVSYIQDKHEMYCPRRPKQNCPIKSCRWQDRAHLLELHFETSHPRTILTEKTVFSYKEINEVYDDIDEVVVKINDQFVYLHFDKRNGIITGEGTIIDTTLFRTSELRMFEFELKPKVSLPTFTKFSRYIRFYPWKNVKIAVINKESSWTSHTNFMKYLKICFVSITVYYFICLVLSKK